MPTATVRVAMYYFLNPHHKSYIDLEFDQGIGKFTLEKVKNDYRSIYELHIPDTAEFGFVHRKDANQAIQNLLTAINLRILDGSAVRQISRVERPKVKYTDEELEEYNVDSFAEFGTSINQPISEEAVYYTYQKLLGLDRNHVTSRSTIHTGIGSNKSTNPPLLKDFLENHSTPDIETVNKRKALLAYDGQWRRLINQSNICCFS
jgi:hypothetical protein